MLVYLSGLTCTEDNAYVVFPSLGWSLFVLKAASWYCRAQKGNFLGPAAKEGIAILFPDTSPRGAGIEGETDSWDFGVGALFTGLRIHLPPCLR